MLQIFSDEPYEFYLDYFPIDPNYVIWQHPTFAEFSENGKAVTPGFVQKDIDDLKAITLQVEDLADKSIAHVDRNGFAGSVTFGDLDASIDAFDRLVCKYLKLLTGGGYATLEPRILLDWTQIFTVPLDVQGQTNLRLEG